LENFGIQRQDPCVNGHESKSINQNSVQISQLGSSNDVFGEFV